MRETFAADTSKRTLREWAVGLTVLFVGLITAHFGVSLFMLSNLGSDSFTVCMQGLSFVTRLPFGVCHVGVLAVLMIVMALTTKGYVKPGTVVCVVFGGWVVDLFRLLNGAVVNEASPLWARVIAMVSGCVVMSFGMSLVIESQSGTGPNDLIAIILSDRVGPRLHLQFRWVRLICDVILVAIGWAMGGVVGVGTLVAAFLVGPTVQFFLPVSRRIARFFLGKCAPKPAGPAAPEGGGKGGESENAESEADSEPGTDDGGEDEPSSDADSPEHH